MQISTLLSLSLSLFLFSYSFSLSSVQGFDFLHEPSSGDYSPPPHSSFISPAPVTENGGGSGGGLEPAPAPHSGDDAASSPYLSPTSDYGGYSPPSPMSFISPAPMTDNGEGSSGGGNSDETAPSRAPTEETGPNMIRWCAVRDEFDNCENFVSLLQPDAFSFVSGYKLLGGNCIVKSRYGRVPADVIMASNSIPNKKRLFVLEMLMNATREGKVGASNVLSPSTQGLDVIKKVTRSYLDKSALVSQSIHELNTPKTEANSSKVNPKSDVSSVSCIFHAPAMMFISILSILVFDIMQ